MMDSDVGWHPLTAFAERLHTSRRIAPGRPRAELGFAIRKVGPDTKRAAAAARSLRPERERRTREERPVRLRQTCPLASPCTACRSVPRRGGSPRIACNPIHRPSGAIAWLATPSTPTKPVEDDER